MNYAKHFSGNADAGTTASHYYLNIDGTVGAAFSSNSSIAKEQVIGEAIESTLKDVGFENCKYYGLVDNKPISYLCLDDTTEGKPGFYIYWQTSYTYFLLGYRTDSNSSVISHVTSLPTATADVSGMRIQNSTFNIFSTATLVANTYDTYVRIKGDPLSSFVLMFSNYNTLNFGLPISISNMQDKRNNRKVVGFNFGATSFEKVAPIYYDTCLSATGAANYTSVNAYNGTFTPVDNYMILVNKFCQSYIYLWFVDGYFPPSGITADSFVEIDGDIYYLQTQGMFKCTSSIETT